MDARTLQALRESIEHWERNVAVTNMADIDTTANACSLCSKFRPTMESNCTGCPVKERTGESYCRSSPFGAAEHVVDEWIASQIQGDDELQLTKWRTAAQAELDFLKSLLPE